jgi:hypothetical protein
MKVKPGRLERRMIVGVSRVRILVCGVTEGRTGANGGSRPNAKPANQLHGDGGPAPPSRVWIAANRHEPDVEASRQRRRVRPEPCDARHERRC